MTVLIDKRWSGQHGIGRYAREVYDRLTVDSRPLPVTGATASGWSALKQVPRGLIYSPGYGGFVRSDRQVLTIHDLIHLKVAWPGRAKYLAYYNLVIRPIVRRTGTVVTVSETSRLAVAEWISDDSVDVVNAGLGCSRAFHTIDDLPATSSPYVVFVGNLRRHKNLRVALEAMARVSDVEFRVLLPESEHAETRALAAALGVSERVHYLPRLSDTALAEQYRGAAATIMPSTLEGFGLPALESIMTGTPVLYWTGCAAVAETVGGRGWGMATADDAEEWAAGIRTAVDSRRRVLAPLPREYDWARTAARIDSVLTRLM